MTFSSRRTAMLPEGEEVSKARMSTSPIIGQLGGQTRDKHQFLPIFDPCAINARISLTPPCMCLKFQHALRGGALPPMEFKLGEKVVYPNHGVGVIEQISYGYLNGRSERYYMLRIVSSGLKVMVPQSNVRQRWLATRHPHPPKLVRFFPFSRKAAPIPTMIGNIASRKIRTGCARAR